MTSEGNYAVQPPSGEVGHLPPVSQTTDRLLDRTPRRGSKRDPRRAKRPAPSASGGRPAPSPAVPEPGARPGTAPAAGEGGDEHVDCLI